MSEKNDKIKELQERMSLLIKKQNKFVSELRELRDEVKKLKAEDSPLPEKVVTKTAPAQDFDTHLERKEVYVPSVPNKHSEIEKAETYEAKSAFDYEKYIGENLLSKLGILITIVGVIIGAKYSIDNDLISPLTRIVLGYIMSIGLLGFGIQLKEKYEKYSAVLVSGAIAIMYFITFAAYSYYDIFPQWVAFLLMVLFTIFTVIAAISYDRQVIAHIGLVGAYAVPFFLSSGSGNMLVFFSYITIINLGILAIAYNKYWKKLYYATFAQTWLIFLVWYETKAVLPEYFGLALSFATVFFILFYLTFLAYKLVKKEEFEPITVVIILINSFIFYGVGYTLMEGHDTWQNYLGLFTVANALLHFGVGSYVKKQNLHDDKLFYLVVGLVLVFITIAIPVQFDGNWVTLLWLGEAVLLFWIGRTKQVPFYEFASYILMVIGLMSVCGNWTVDYYAPQNIGEDLDSLPILNIQFLTSILAVAAFAFIAKINSDKIYEIPFKDQEEDYDRTFNMFLGGVLIGLVYFTFRAEIAAYFNQLYESTKINMKVDDSDQIRTIYNTDLLSIKNIWLLLYTIAFLILLAVLDLTKLKNKTLGHVSLAFNALIIVVFLTYGIYELTNLHDSYFNSKEPLYFSKSLGYIAIRYFSFALFAGLFVMTFRYIKERYSMKPNWILFDVAMHISILTIITSEILNWLNTAGASDANTLIITIVWGVYALMLIGLGIWKNRQHLRIGAFILFGITLLKLFFIDIAHFGTIAKTIVLVSLGVLLLVISFLYNKYKHLIVEEDKSIAENED